jgi:hypothetical protein
MHVKVLAWVSFPSELRGVVVKNIATDLVARKKMQMKYY